MRIAQLALAIVALLGPARARAETDPRRAEAAERFDHGMALLEEGDNAGALAELTRVQELAPHPRVLYNLGLLYAATNRPVEAARALDQVVAAPGTLPAASLERARKTRDEQARRVALLEVTTSVPATIEADGVEVGKTPLGHPLSLAAGTHVVAATSPGYLPARREITLAGQTTEKLAFELLPSELRMAHLAVRAPLPDAEVLVDGQRMGRTPLPGSLALAPGRRVVELRRAGYRPARREIALDDGATGELAFDLPAEDEGAPVRRGRLVLAVSEADPDITVDGQPRGAYRGPLSLPPGVHQVRAARAGFLPVERLVTVPEGGDGVSKITLVPTPETRAEYKGRAQLRRRWGWAGVVGGAALAIGGGVMVAVNRGSLQRAQANIDDVGSRPPCSTQKDLQEMQECDARLAMADDRYNSRKTIQNVGLVALGVGVVAAGVGTALLLTGDDPYRYDRPPRELDAATPAPVTIGGWLTSGGGGLALAGGF